MALIGDCCFRFTGFLRADRLVVCLRFIMMIPRCSVLTARSTVPKLIAGVAASRTMLLLVGSVRAKSKRSNGHQIQP